MTDVNIVGGGIIGLLSAYELACKGHTVTVFEKGECGRESSWAGGGILSPLYPWRYPDAVTELARWSQIRYRELCEVLAAETGIDPEWTQSGMLMLDLSEDECNSAEEWARRFGYNLQRISRNEVDTLVAGLGTKAAGAIWMPDVAQLRNPRFLKALKRHLQGKGVTLAENSPIQDIVCRDGKMTAVRVGSREISADRVVVCSGAWSAQVLDTAGIELAVSPVKGQMLLYKTTPGLLQHIIMHDGYYLIPRRDGRILAGSTLERVGFDKQTTDAAREMLHGKATEILPELAEAEIERHWAGLRPGTIDGIPFIGEVPGCDGLFVNAGQFRNGVVTGLASARLLADIVVLDEPIIDPSPYLPAQSQKGI